MELEINEPFLYIGSSRTAAARFADAIVRSTDNMVDGRPAPHPRNEEATS
jgi:hypothetical protein